MKVGIRVIILMTFFSGFSQEMTLRKGAVIDNLTVSDTLTSTFALYLPTTFSSENPTPIVFVVDPQQRGKQALSLFLEAAEKYNFAIAAPNSISADTTLKRIHVTF